MVLMLNEKQNDFASKEYRPLSECLPLISKILDYDVSMMPRRELRAMLHKCKNWLQSKTIQYRNKDGLLHNTKLYYIGTLKALVLRPTQYEHEIIDLELAFENATNIKLPRTVNSISFKDGKIENNSPDEFFQDRTDRYTDQPMNANYERDVNEPNESNMDYCNQQLLDKYQFEGKKVVKLTESQFKRLHKLINRI